MITESEPCRCDVCGKEQHYEVVITTNSFMRDLLSDNKCQCGNQLTTKNILINKCSPSYRQMYRIQKISEREDQIDIANGHKPDVCDSCGSKRVHRGFLIGGKMPEGYSENDGYILHNAYLGCNDCGHKQYDTYENVEELYEYVSTLDDGKTLLLKKNSDYDSIVSKAIKESEYKWNEIENQLISEGVLPTKDAEAAYSKRYYKKLHRGSRLYLIRWKIEAAFEKIIALLSKFRHTTK